MMKSNSPLSLWKKFFFATIAFFLFATTLYFPCEVTYRLSQGIPVHLLNTAMSQEEDKTTRSGNDTTTMDFDSVHYYEIFQRSENPILFYEPKPGFSKGAVQINSHGFRDREFERLKPAGTTRIVVLGDSVVWGHGIILADTFAKQLENLLNDRLKGKYEVINFGVSGYSLQQEVEQYIERASKYDPDIAILGLCINDSIYSSVEGDFFSQQNGSLFSKSYLLSRLMVKFDRVLHDVFGVPEKYLQHFVDVSGELTRLRDASPDVSWLVLMFPRLDNLNNYQSHADHRILTQPARNLGFSVRDLLADYQNHSDEKLSIDPIHPNRLGNTIAAKAAYDALLQNGMIRSRSEN